MIQAYKFKYLLERLPSEEMHNMEWIQIIIVMFFVGILLGFIGAGGSGFVIAILTAGFGYPIHIAMGTALAAMMFSSFSGAVSQIREKNTDVLTGVIVGITGAIAAWYGTRIAIVSADYVLTWATASMLTLSSITLFFQLVLHSKPVVQLNKRSFRYIISAIGVGLATGFLSGTFGIGSTPFIQVGLILFLGLSIQVSAGTTMFIILPIAAAGGWGYFTAGILDLKLLLFILIGMMTGSYIGAKFTKRAPQKLLKIGMIITPLIAAGLLLLK